MTNAAQTDDVTASTERRPQAPRSTPAASPLTDDQTNLQQGLDAQGLGEDDIDQADPERKRRRRRSRRGRRGTDEGSGIEGREDQATENEDFDHVSSNALSGAPVAYVEHGASVTVTPVASSAPSAPAAPEALVVAPTPDLPTPVTTAVLTAAPIQVATVSTAPTLTQTPRVDQATLHAIVQTAGLQWVETDPARVAQALASQNVVPVKLGREPKPKAAVSSQPLVQVETIR